MADRKITALTAVPNQSEPTLNDADIYLFIREQLNGADIPLADQPKRTTLATIASYIRSQITTGNAHLADLRLRYQQGAETILELYVPGAQGANDHTITTFNLVTGIDSRIRSADNAASATQRGNVELATSQEAIDGVDAEKAVTPAGLAAHEQNQGNRGLDSDAVDARVRDPSNAASVAQRGNIELANTTEADDGVDTTKAMTPALVKRVIPAAPHPATDTDEGLVELATNQETIDGSDASKAVTPAGLKAWEAAQDARGGGGTTTVQSATMTRQGIVELANQSEADQGSDNTRVMTPFLVRRVSDARVKHADNAATENSRGNVQLARGSDANASSVVRGDDVVTSALMREFRDDSGSRYLASESQRGFVELASQTEADGGSDTSRAMTSALVKRQIDQRISNAALPSTNGSTTNAPTIAQVVAGLAGKADASSIPAAPSQATTSALGLVRIAANLDDTGNADVTLASQVKTGLAGKEDTLADAVRVATGGASGQLLSRAASGGTSWIDAPSGGGNGGSTSGGLTKMNLYFNASTAPQAANTILTLSQSIKDFDLLYVQASETVSNDIGFSFADPAEITPSTIPNRPANEMGVFVDNANDDRIFIRWETNTRARVFFSLNFRIVKIVGLNFAAGSGGGNGGTGATTFAALTDTPTAASLRANSGEHLVVNQTGDEIVTQSVAAAVRDGVSIAGVGQTAVDNRVTTIGDCALLPRWRYPDLQRSRPMGSQPGRGTDGGGYQLPRWIHESG